MDEDLDLPGLFATADAIGDKYLTAEELAERDAELEQVRYETWMSLTKSGEFERGRKPLASDMGSRIPSQADVNRQSQTSF